MWTNTHTRLLSVELFRGKLYQKRLVKWLKLYDRLNKFLADIEVVSNLKSTPRVANFLEAHHRWCGAWDFDFISAFNYEWHVSTPPPEKGTKKRTETFVCSGKGTMKRMKHELRATKTMQTDGMGRNLVNKLFVSQHAVIMERNECSGKFLSAQIRRPPNEQTLTADKVLRSQLSVFLTYSIQNRLNNH